MIEAVLVVVVGIFLLVALGVAILIAKLDHIRDVIEKYILNK